MTYKRGIILILLIGALCSVAGAQIPDPESVLKFKIGADREVADMHQIIRYFQLLDESSDRIVVREIGKTTEGNPFIVAFITSEANHKRLEHYRQIQQRLADPRSLTHEEADALIAEGKAVVMINCSIHATEIGAAQMSMQLAYDLATGEDPKIRKILDQTILLLTPMHNPDGIQMVVDWYRQNLGTPYEGGRMPWLYHKYVGHDNNRDWYMFTQVETQLTIQVHNAWHPQIIMDMHQTGSRGARIFVPPYVDPYEPNVDPILRQAVAMMGSFIATEMTARGMAGVIHSHRYDGWTPARAYHHYHGGIRVLTEAASIRLATPVEIAFEDLADHVKQPSVKYPLPWQGGRWSLKDIVDYDYAAAFAALENAAALRGHWLRNFYRIHQNAVYRKEPPFAFIIAAEQKDLSSTMKMLQILQMGGVEIHRSDASFEADGAIYPQGTLFIKTAQPYGPYAKALLERQVYPEIREYPGAPLKTPYDVVAHTLPLLMGVDVVQIDRPFETVSTLVENIDRPSGNVVENEALYFFWDHCSNDDIVALNRLLEKGYRPFWAAEPFKAGGKTVPAGTMLIKNGPGVQKDLRDIANTLNVSFRGLSRKPRIDVYAIKPVRLGLYKSWTASMDEGWTRWVLEQFEFPYASIHDSEIREGDLNEGYDVILFPNLSDRNIVEGLSDRNVPPEYAGGLGEQGIKKIRSFVADGGILIALDGSAEFAIERFGLSVKNVTAGLDRGSFFVPGSILRVENDTDHPIAYGFKEEWHLFFRRSPAFETDVGVSVVRYHRSDLLLSGWINGEDVLTGSNALLDIPHQEGRIILIGFPAQYRAQTHGTFRYLFNAIHYGPAEKMRL